MSSVVVYSSNFCGYCYRAKGLLKQKGIAFREIEVDMNTDARAEMRKKAGGVNTVPQIFIGEIHVGGCDDLYALEASDKLDDLLKAS